MKKLTKNLQRMFDEARKLAKKLGLTENEAFIYNYAMVITAFHYETNPSNLALLKEMLKQYEDSLKKHPNLKDIAASLIQKRFSLKSFAEWVKLPLLQKNIYHSTCRK